jgi:uncharacterized peroxidase-related enzyme
MDVVDALERDPNGTALDERGAALVAYAVKLTRAPREVTEADTDPLRRAGLSDAGIHDAATVTAYFNFVNRVALGLGVELESPRA